MPAIALEKAWLQQRKTRHLTVGETLELLLARAVKACEERYVANISLQISESGENASAALVKNLLHRFVSASMNVSTGKQSSGLERYSWREGHHRHLYTKDENASVAMAATDHRIRRIEPFVRELRKVFSKQ